LRAGDGKVLREWTRASSGSAGLAQRARILLLATQGHSNTEIGCSPPSPPPQSRSPAVPQRRDRPRDTTDDALTSIEEIRRSRLSVVWSVGAAVEGVVDHAVDQGLVDWLVE